jgi:PBP1b-binding outer membrane lipoprotein LpoB
MKIFYFGPLVPMLAFTLFFSGCANQPAQTQSTQQASAAMPTPTPSLQSYRPMAGGMGRGY